MIDKPVVMVCVVLVAVGGRWCFGQRWLWVLLTLLPVVVVFQFLSRRNSKGKPGEKPVDGNQSSGKASTEKEKSQTVPRDEKTQESAVREGKTVSEKTQDSPPENKTDSKTVEAQSGAQQKEEHADAAASLSEVRPAAETQSSNRDPDHTKAEGTTPAPELKEPQKASAPSESGSATSGDKANGSTPEIQEGWTEISSPNGEHKGSPERKPAVTYPEGSCVITETPSFSALQAKLAENLAALPVLPSAFVEAPERSVDEKEETVIHAAERTPSNNEPLASPPGGAPISPPPKKPENGENQSDDVVVL